MITKENLKEKLSDLKVSEFNETLKELHNYVMEVTLNGSNWSVYDEPEVKFMIDTYFQQLNEFAKKASKAPEKTKEDKQERKPEKTTSESKKSDSTSAKTEKKHIVTRRPKSEPIEDDEDFSLVERIPDELRFIRRYLSLHEKKKSKEDILRFINALHRSIAERKIRKSSPYAAQIEHIQKNLVKKYNSMSGRPEKITLGPQTINEFKAVIAQEKVMPSVQLIKRYINLNGKFGVKEKAKTLLEAIKRAWTKGRVLKSDKYSSLLNKMYTNLQSFVKNKNQKILSIQSPELNGLNGILEECGCTREEVNGLDGFCNQEDTACVEQGEVMSLSDARNAQFETIGLQSEWRDLIGEACKPTHLFVYGNGGSGKSSFMLKCAEYLNQLGNKILYAAGEQYNTPTFSELVTRLNIKGNKDFVIVRDLSVLNPKDFDVVALDSKDSLGIEVEDFREMKKAYPDQSFIISSQGTKSGDFTGSGQWRNEVDTMIYCDTGVAKTDQDKNRWGGKGEMRIFDDTALQQAA